MFPKIHKKNSLKIGHYSLKNDQKLELHKKK